MMRVSVLASSALACVFALGAAACLEEGEAPAASEDALSGPAPDDQLAQVQNAGPPAVEGEIDWEAARTARAQSSVTDSNIQIQSATGAPAAVPMLLPSGVVMAQNARPPAVVTTPDGYFATYQTPRYDAIVNGTKTAYQAGAAPADRDAMVFTTGEGSAQLAFSRFGADYLIEFECRAMDDGESCITEAEAREFAESLFVAQTQ
jgi:hypothetical protein